MKKFDFAEAAMNLSIILGLIISIIIVTLLGLYIGSGLERAAMSLGIRSSSASWIVNIVGLFISILMAASIVDRVAGERQKWWWE